MGDDGEDGVEKIVGDGEPVHLGDVITLSNPNHGGGGYIGVRLPLPTGRAQARCARAPLATTATRARAPWTPK